ncbi:MAG: long-chain fatty acid--CoA ligase [Bacillota bacterium]
MQTNQLSTISEFFYATCNRFPSRQAQLFNPNMFGNDNNGSFTYQEVLDRVEAMACGLLALGLEKGERAAIMAANSPYWVHADFAIINCGGVTVTIYPTLSANEASYIINDSSSRYLFVGSEDILARIRPEPGNMPSLKKIIVLDLTYRGGDDLTLGLNQFLDLGREFKASGGQLYTGRWQGNTLEDWASIIYTSGTTGKGKGAILTHYTFSSRLAHTMETFARVGVSVTEEDLCLSFLPLSHIYERGCGEMLAVYTGACTAFADKPATIMQDMQKYNPTWFNCVPRLYERVYLGIQEQMASSKVKKALFNWALDVGQEVLAYRTDSHGRINMALDFDIKQRLPLGLRLKFTLADKLFARIRALFGSRFKQSFSASASLAPELSTMFYIMGIRVIEGYGLTETCTACNFNPPAGLKPGKVGPAANGSTGRLAEDGEYLVGGAGLFIGYLNQPGETEAAFTPDGWFRTGDLGEIDKDGYLRIVDRKKAIICLNTGKNVAPAKIENLYSTSGVIEQVFIVGDERKYITALLVPNFNHFIQLFDRENIPYDQDKLVYSHATGMPICVEVGEDFVAQPLLREMIAKEVAAANNNLESFEQVKRYAVLSKRFTEERGEITPTMKTKKRVILENYQDVIEGLYK